MLREIFSVKRMHQEPQTIALPANNKAEAAFELGSLDTSDDRLIGLYLVEVKPNVWLEDNRVGLRNLLRNIYKYDVDGALVVFAQKDKWRLSFVSEIRVANSGGELIDQITEPKRYTYFLGDGEKVKTPTDRIFSLKNKPLSLEDIRDAFSVEALNEEFYKIVARQFYKLAGATEGKGSKTVSYERTLRLPSVSADDRKTYQEFAVRLIGRTVFCWFLKMKKPNHASDEGIPLLPEFLLSSDAVRKNKGYYHSILELLFFQTLNTPMDKRRNDLPKGAETIPFLNGGLFEPHSDDFYKPDPQTGLSKNLNTLVIPDEWFEEFFEKLEQFNFTIDENSVVDVEVSVDPEMLGRIFENLLAEIDPDSGETARKATGSFYTPREIVDYMASESLVQYLVNKTGLDEKQLHPLFRLDQEVTFSKPEAHTILDALDKLKILDPACGSGAFPIGVLQKIVMALQKLDPQSQWWKARQIEKVDNAYIRQQIKSKLDSASVEYARKIGIIQNSLYGVDIQPVAAEISKLRCFLTLIVDENIDETKPNRGVEPLPNLEFKFVTADTLIGLPAEDGQQSLFSNYEELVHLKELRKDYLQSYGEEKEKIKIDFLNTQKSIFKQQLSFFDNPNSRAYKLSVWNPFSHDLSDWFDPEWMFGVEKFDMIIGNPPYVQLQKDNGALAKKYSGQGYQTFERMGDIYSLFYERGHQLLQKGGILCYITSNKWMRAGYGESTRSFFLNHTNPLLLVDFAGQKIFKSATVDTNIMLFTKGGSDDQTNACVVKEDAILNLGVYISKYKTKLKFSNSKSWVVLSPIEQRIKEKIERIGTPLRDWDIQINYGIKTGYNEAFIISGEKKDELIAKDPKCAEIIRPILRGRDIKRYGYTFPDLWLINTHNGVKEKGLGRVRIEDYPL